MKKYYRQVSAPKSGWMNFIFSLSPFALLFALWWPTRFIPYWWDSAGYLIYDTHNLMMRNFWPLAVQGSGSTVAHPVLFSVVLAMFWKVFGESLLVSHVVNLLSGILALVYLKKIGQVIFASQRLALIFSTSVSILLVVSPVFYAQLAIIYLEIPVMAAALAAVYYYLLGDWRRYILSSSVMLLTKETSVFVVIAIFLTELLILIKRLMLRQKIQILAVMKLLPVILSPIFVLLAWFAYHHQLTGWWIFQPGSHPRLPIQLLINQTQLVTDVLLVQQWRFLGLIILAIAGWKWVGDPGILRKINGRFLLVLSFLVIGTILTFGLSEFLYRYIIIGLPFFYLLTVYLLMEVAAGGLSENQKAILTGLVTIIFAGIFYTGWNNHKQVVNWQFSPMEANLEYQDIIDVTKNIASFIQSNHPDSTIYSSFPMDYALTQPYQGYVTKPIKFKKCSEYKAGDEIKYMVFHFFSPEQAACARLTQIIKWDKALKFEKNGKFMMFYAKTSEDSVKVISN